MRKLICRLILKVDTWRPLPATQRPQPPLSTCFMKFAPTNTSLNKQGWQDEAREPGATMHRRNCVWDHSSSRAAAPSALLPLLLPCWPCHSSRYSLASAVCSAAPNFSTPSSRVKRGVCRPCTEVAGRGARAYRAGAGACTAWDPSAQQATARRNSLAGSPRSSPALIPDTRTVTPPESCARPRPGHPSRHAHPSRPSRCGCPGR